MIISKQIKESKICNLGYIIRSGSYNEKDDEHGLAHLVEHMLFKGTNKRDYKEINNSMESIGGYLNAETNFDYTKYYCCVPFNQWKNGLEILNDIMFNHTIPQKELDKERKVVIEELKMYKEDRKSTRLNSSHANISYAVFCLKKKNTDAFGPARK